MMLKIKDNIDLKELEKYGFSKNEFGDLEKNIDIKDFLIFYNVNHISIRIDCTQYIGRIGIIIDGSSYCFDKELDILYDLIKADLVEKIEEE